MSVRIGYEEIINVKELGINIDTIAGYNNTDVVKNVIEDALNIADEKYIKLMEESRNNKNKLVAYNRKQKKLWLVQNKLKKILQEK